MKSFIMSFLYFAFSFAYACPVGKTGLSTEEFNKLKKSGTSHSHSRKVSSVGTPPTLPTAKSETPWGGKNAGKWMPEAILANAASAWLNEGWSTKDVADVLVSVPVKMIFTGERVYGDGQTNAGIGFGPNWGAREPQLVATLLKFKSGDRRIIFQFAKDVKLNAPKVKLTYFVDGSRKDETVDVKSISGKNLAGWNVPSALKFGDLESSRLVWVRPDGWDSSFPIDFRFAAYSNQNLLKNAGAAKTAGKSPLDPLGIYSRVQKDGGNAEHALLNSTYGPEWVKNDQGRNDLRNESIHGEIHAGGSEIKTAVGGGLTWLVDHGPNSTFKNLYTCFDARSFDSESKYGVPSGGGWHEIGDAAETIINDLENTPVPVGFATGLPWPTPPDNTKFAWGLSDVATIRFLMPGEGIVTPVGDQTWKEDENFRSKGDGSARGKEPSGGGRNYHWFFFPSDEPTCTQEWVHHCRPTEKNDFGLDCP